MASQRIKFKCPFCKKADIEADYLPPSVRFKKGSWGGSKPGAITSEGSFTILVNKCPNCGKTDKEIKKAYERGIEMSREERIKKIKESGLPTQIEF